MTEHPRASVIVPTYRGREVLDDCLNSLDRQTAASYEVIVVDDGSGDGTSEWVRSTFPSTRVVELAENGGFCRAVNQGIRVARGDVIALINNDATAEPRWLDALLDALDESPEIGFCASCSLQAGAPGTLDGAGDEYSRFGIPFRVGRGEQDRDQFPPRDILFASGGACAYRRKVFDRVGLFDERLEAYYEDLDLGLRAWSAGWRGRYVPGSVVVHRGGWSDRVQRGTRLTTRNAILVIAKNWPRRLILRQLPWLGYGQLRTMLWALRTGQGRAWLAGLLSAARNAPEVRRGSQPRVDSWERILAREYPFGIALPRISTNREADRGNS
jgi:GT2 family glycosyltransferase